MTIEQQVTDLQRDITNLKDLVRDHAWRIECLESVNAAKEPSACEAASQPFVMQVGRRYRCRNGKEAECKSSDGGFYEDRLYRWCMVSCNEFFTVNDIGVRFFGETSEYDIVAYADAPRADATEPAADFISFWNQQAEWSQATFGKDSERGPIGPLKHLVKEANEAIEATQAIERPGISVSPEELDKQHEEIADCLFLTFDAARRAGMSPVDLLHVAFKKLAKNKSRQWQKPTSDEPVEHVRESEPASDGEKSLALIARDAAERAGAILNGSEKELSYFAASAAAVAAAACKALERDYEELSDSTDAEIARLKTSLSVSAACLDDERTKLLKLKADLAAANRALASIGNDALAEVRLLVKERDAALARATVAEKEAAKYRLVWMAEHKGM